MTRIRGWGILLAIGMPLLIFFSWSRLSVEKSRINLERYETWTSGRPGAWSLPVTAYFAQNRKLAMPGDAILPPVPKNMGVKAWSLQPNTTVLVELDAVADGKPVRLTYVPIVRPGGGLSFDCVSDVSVVYVGRICMADAVRSAADIPAQLAANNQAIGSLPAVIGASGTELPVGSVSGSVVAVPQKVSDLDHCGFQCVKPQSCVTPRPLACGKIVTEGNTRRFEIAATTDDYRGNSFDTRSAADQACTQALGTGFTVVRAASLSGIFKLTGGNEYWVHNDLRAEGNCWKTDYR